MFQTIDEACRLTTAILAQPRMTEVASVVDVVLCPPAVDLQSVHNILRDSLLLLGAQNMNAVAEGAFTGEISWKMLQGLCQFVIIGHSERRQFYGETDEDVNRKVIAACAAGLKPITCVGENASAYSSGDTDIVVTKQVQALIHNLPPEHLQHIVIAYEPIWAIGSAVAASGNIAQRVAGLIRAVIANECGDNDLAQLVRILYGGSVNNQNIADFTNLPDIDGALVGRLSLQPREFVELAAAFSQP